MGIYFLAFAARPGESLEESKRFGGAHINCWVRAGTASEAQTTAAADIKARGWIIETVESEPRVEAQPPASALEYFEEAKIDGSCYVFHTWPIADHSEQSLH